MILGLKKNELEDGARLVHEVVPPTPLHAGDQVHDSAQVSGIVAGFPANDVTFTWYSGLTGTAGEDCTTGDVVSTETVALDALAVDDMVLVRPGARVPVDGTVVEGSADVDESMITGES